MNQENEKQIKCGLVMPISEIDGCSSAHWKDVLEIIKEALNETEFDVSLVSTSDEAGVIQKRIVQNLYSNPVVICDVSGKNPNVMFELGMRLAFDKPTVVIKDDKTDYAFDTSPIEHIPYPRDLHFHQIVQFQRELRTKVQATYEAGKDPQYSSFLKHFVQYEAKSIPSEEVPYMEVVAEELADMRRQMTRLARESRSYSQAPRRRPSDDQLQDVVCVRGAREKWEELSKWIIEELGLGKFGIQYAGGRESGREHIHLRAEESLAIFEKEIKSKAEELGLRVAWVK